MRYNLLILCMFFAACSSGNPHLYSTNKEHTPARPEWKQGEFLKLTGIIWPSSESKFYIDTVDGKSALLKGSVIEKLKPGTKISLAGRIECVNGYGAAGASDVIHSQTSYFVNVSEYKILDEAAWDIAVQNAVDKDKTGYSVRE